MPFYISWKNKFRLLIIVTLVSLALMAASSFWATQRLSGALQAREHVVAYSSTSFALMSHWLRLATLRQVLTPATQGEFRQRLSMLEGLAGQLVVQARALGQPSIGESAEQIAQLLRAEANLQRKWLELSQQLGLSPFEGKRLALSSRAEQLEPIKIGLIQPFIATALRNQRDYLSTFDSGYAEKALSAVAEMQAKVDELKWQENQIGQAVAGFNQAFAHAHALIQQIQAVDTQLAHIGQQIEQRIDEQSSNLQSGLLATTARQAQQARRSARWIMGLSFAGVALFLLITLSQASRILMAQLNSVTRLLSQVASGNLTGALVVGRNPKDEFNQLGEEANRMIRGIAQIVRQVVEANRELEQLHTYLRETMRRLDDNSTRMEMQTEQAASASRQISVTVDEIARRTSDIDGATRTAYGAAQTGNGIIGTSAKSRLRLSQLIQETYAQVVILGQSSSKVTGIIDVINGLADQTNLLALNAAIEAARAGDAGRGFSVVADEVRTLAQKTMAATTDIAQIIGEFRQQAQSMGELMTSGLSLAADNDEHAGQVAQVIEEVSHAMERLTAEMTQVVVAVEEISSSTLGIAGKIEEINLHTCETKGLRLSLDQHANGLSARIEALHCSARLFHID